MSSQVGSVYQDETGKMHRQRRGEMYLRRKLKELYSSDLPKHNCDGRGSDDQLLPTYGTFEFQLAAASRDEMKSCGKTIAKTLKSGKASPRDPKRLPV